MIYAYVNGKIKPAHKASVSIFDRGLVLGDGLFESLRAVDYFPEFLSEHYQRFKSSARKLRIKVPVGKKEMGLIIYELCKKSRLRDSAVRITLTRGEYSGGLSLARSGEPTLIISVRPVENLDSGIYSKGVKIAVSTIGQEAAGGVEPTIKTLNYLGNILAKAEADRKKCFEAILLGKNGEIAELSTSSFFCCLGGKIITPPVAVGILPGITRQSILSVSKKAKLPFCEKNLKISQASRFSEAFLTSSIRGVVPIIKIDNKVIGDGRVGEKTFQIQQLYQKLRIKDRDKIRRTLENS